VIVSTSIVLVSSIIVVWLHRSLRFILVKVSIRRYRQLAQTYTLWQQHPSSVHLSVFQAYAVCAAALVKQKMQKTLSSAPYKWGNGSSPSWICSYFNSLVSLFASISRSTRSCWPRKNRLADFTYCFSVDKWMKPTCIVLNNWFSGQNTGMNDKCTCFL